MDANHVDLSSLLEPDNESLGYGGFYITEAEVVNMLLIGRSQSGKTAILESLKNPRVGMKAAGFSCTRDPRCHNLILRNASIPSKTYQLNIIDTPGLREVAKNDKVTRPDSEILSLLRTCIEENITSLNVVCFVSKAGGTHLYDSEVFNELMTFLGPTFSECSMMILTNCDKFNITRIEEIQGQIREHSKTAELFKYCHLGIFCTGIADYDDLQTHENDIQKLVFCSKLKALEGYRKNFVGKIFERAEHKVHIKLLQKIMEQVKEEKTRIVTAALDETKIEFHEEKKDINKKHAEEIAKMNEKMDSVRNSCEQKLRKLKEQYEEKCKSNEIILLEVKQKIESQRKEEEARLMKERSEIEEMQKLQEAKHSEEIKEQDLIHKQREEQSRKEMQMLRDKQDLKKLKHMEEMRQLKEETDLKYNSMIEQETRKQTQRLAEEQKKYEEIILSLKEQIETKNDEYERWELEKIAQMNEEMDSLRKACEENKRKIQEQYEEKSRSDKIMVLEEKKQIESQRMEEKARMLKETGELKQMLKLQEVKHSEEIKKQSDEQSRKEMQMLRDKQEEMGQLITKKDLEQEGMRKQTQKHEETIFSLNEQIKLKGVECDHLKRKLTDEQNKSVYQKVFG